MLMVNTLVSFDVLGVKYRLYCESVKICDL